MSKKKQKHQRQFGEEFFFLLVIIVTMSAGIAYLFYSVGYANAVEERTIQKIQAVQRISMNQ